MQRGKEIVNIFRVQLQICYVKFGHEEQRCFVLEGVFVDLSVLGVFFKQCLRDGLGLCVSGKLSSFYMLKVDESSLDGLVHKGTVSDLVLCPR